MLLCAAVVFLDQQLTPGALRSGAGQQGEQDTSPVGCIWTHEVVQGGTFV